MKISKTLYIRYLFTLLLPLSGLLQACDMIEYHPYDLDIDGETEVNARNIQRIETALDGKKEFSFAVISDTQRWYDETEDAVADMNEKGGIDFVVHTGDLSDFGMKLEFEKQRDILNGLSVPYVCLLGNHDCLATGKEVFNRIFGEENFSFTAGDVLFICLNTKCAGVRLFRCHSGFLVSGKAAEKPFTRHTQNNRCHACRTVFRTVQQQCGQSVSAVSAPVPGPAVLCLRTRTQYPGK